MKKFLGKVLSLIIPIICLNIFSCHHSEHLSKILTAGVPASSKDTLTQSEVIQGLKEALQVGTQKATSLASATDGFFKNPEIFIPWPDEAKEMKSKLLELGFSKQVNEFELTLNRAAEEASKKAAPIFINAITSMSIRDGWDILRGNDTTATHYFRKTTYQPLKNEFLPVVKKAIEDVKLTSYWSPLANIYNKIPGVKKVNPDLEDYTASQAINGLMKLIAKEETTIRKNPEARVTDILKKVFGYKKS
ncbi:MAG: DUF4197 domain-containing protein [Bacteroidia bacterium]|nr:DUF4197 domain-containing protein [Bacteroidia bacterium]